jgi:hypothetical protein
VDVAKRERLTRPEMRQAAVVSHYSSSDGSNLRCRSQSAEISGPRSWTIRLTAPVRRNGVPPFVTSWGNANRPQVQDLYERFEGDSCDDRALQRAQCSPYLR